jgi:hypothetical protein
VDFSRISIGHGEQHSVSGWNESQQLDEGVVHAALVGGTVESLRVFTALASRPKLPIRGQDSVGHVSSQTLVSDGISVGQHFLKTLRLSYGFLKRSKVR